MHEWSTVGKILTKEIRNTWRKMSWPWVETGPSRWEVGNNRLCPCTAENWFHTSRETYCFCRV